MGTEKMNEREKATMPRKKGFFTLLKESMTKTSTGCGPGCGCAPEESDTKNPHEDGVEESGEKDG